MDNMEVVTHETTCEPMVEDNTAVPLLAYKDDDLVDITMVEVVSDDGVHYKTVKQVAFESLPAAVNRLVIEMPNGCLETYIFAREGSEIRFVDNRNYSVWYRCQRGA